jgi:mono/diheme cytochrome c family protein
MVYFIYSFNDGGASMRKVSYFILAFIAAFLLAACSGSQTGDPTVGEELYTTRFYTKPRSRVCSECHTLDGTERFAPTFQGLSERAAERVEGMTAEEYLRQSIIDPDAFVVGEHYLQMPLDYGDVLTEEQIDDLVAFMLTQ